MQIHEVARATKLKKRKRVGRGGKRGTYSGRGSKGQRSRSGHRIRPAIRDTIKKIPKRRGFKFSTITGKSVVINLAEINKAFKEGDTVSPKSLDKKGLINLKKSSSRSIKILGRGELKKKLIFKGVEMSKSAQDKINSSGSTIHS